MTFQELNVKPEHTWIYESQALDLWQKRTGVVAIVVPNVMAGGEIIPPWIVARMLPGEDIMCPAFDREPRPLPHFKTCRAACEYMAKREGLPAPYMLEELDWK